jgi:alpha-mannosidase
MEEEPNSKNPKEYIIHMVGYSHIDPVWRWDVEEGKKATLLTFRSMVELMKKVPGFTFSIDVAQCYQWVEQGDPNLFQEVREYVKEGRWEIIGGSWIQPDCNLPCGESLIRQILYGKRYFMEKFGKDIKVGANLDTFGHCWTMPQILKKSGIDFYVFCRPGPTNKELPSIFWWKGPDNSYVLASRPIGHYGTWFFRKLPKKIKDIIKEKRTFPGDVMCFYGKSDHGGGPSLKEIQLINRLKEKGGLPRVEFSTTEKAFDSINQPGNDYPELKDELQHFARGCYSTMAEIKKKNRRAENLLLSAEKFASLAFNLFDNPYPQDNFTEAWRKVLFNQHHDILPGSSIKSAYKDVELMYQEVFDFSQASLKDSLSTIAKRVNTREQDGLPLIVFNQLPWQRKEPLETELMFEKNPVSIKVIDEQGKEMPCQILERYSSKGKTVFKVIFIARIPAFGYRIYWFKTDDKSKENNFSEPETPFQIENEFFRLAVDPERGSIKSIYDKKNGIEILSGPANLPLLLKDQGDAWGRTLLSHEIKSFRKEIGFLKLRTRGIEIVDWGPVKKTLRIKSGSGSSEVIQDISLYKGLDYIYCEMSADWKEKFRLLKLPFPINIGKEAVASYEIPYGHIIREANGEEEPAQNWIDVEGKIEGNTYGVSLINNSKYGFDIKENEIRMTVIRSPLYCPPRCFPLVMPRFLQPFVRREKCTDQGLHSFSYVLIPHKGNWRNAETVRKGFEFNNPLLVLTESRHPGILPAQASFLEIRPSNVVAVSFKKAEDSDDLILRFYETDGKESIAEIRLPWHKFSRSIPLKPFEIKTLKFSFNSQKEAVSVKEVDMLERIICDF